MKLSSWLRVSGYSLTTVVIWEMNKWMEEASVSSSLHITLSIFPKMKNIYSIYLKCGVTPRERKDKKTHLLVYIPNGCNSQGWDGPEPEMPSWSFAWVARAQVLQPSSTVLIQSWAARAQISTHMGFQLHRQWLNPLYHNTDTYMFSFKKLFWMANFVA